MRHTARPCQPSPRRRALLLAPLLAAAGVSLAAAQALVPERAAERAITDAALRAHVRFLADDQTGGRQPGSPGDQLARSYIESQLIAMGLQPAGDVVNGKPTFHQFVDLVGVRSRLRGAPEFRSGDTTIPVKIAIPPSDMLLVAGEQTPDSELRGADLVFVGYGITAPEYQWDDYKGVDLRGKVLLMMNNDPESDPKLFAGKTRLYYGRWDYKYAEAARHGAVGAIIIHTTPSAAYPWSVVRNSWDTENFDAPDDPKDATPRLKVRGWLTEEASRRVAQGGGADLDQLRKAAERRDFRPIPLTIRIWAQLQNEVRRVRSANVLALLPGSDPALRKEAVAVTAHFDHLGTQPDYKGDDKIFNGAIDNATGVAGLLTIARAAALGPAPKRSLLIAALTGEEDGLIGSQHLVKHAPAAAPTLVADINMDGLNVFGKSPQIVQIGRGKSSGIDAVVDALAGAQRRKVLPDPMPDKGAYYRSDQFSFARIGVPSIYLGRPIDLLDAKGKLLPGAGLAQVERYTAELYHRPGDEYREDWNFDGAVQDVQLLYLAALRLANGPRPSFNRGDEFAPKKR